MENEFVVFGGTDSSSRDSLGSNEIKNIKEENINIKFMGKIDNPLLFQNYDFPILIVPSSYGEGLPRAIAEALGEDGLNSLSETYVQKSYEPYDSVVKLSRATISRDEGADGSNSGVFAVAKGCLESIDNNIYTVTI